MTKILKDVHFPVGRKVKHPWTSLKKHEAFIIPWPKGGTRAGGASYISRANERYAPKAFDFVHSPKGITIVRIR